MVVMHLLMLTEGQGQTIVRRTSSISSEEVATLHSSSTSSQETAVEVHALAVCQRANTITVTTAMSREVGVGVLEEVEVTRAHLLHVVVVMYLHVWPTDCRRTVVKPSTTITTVSCFHYAAVFRLE